MSGRRARLGALILAATLAGAAASCGGGGGEAASTGEVKPPECGNGIVEGDEECDDANADDTDDCLSTCVEARCGDGYVHAGVEECDDGNLEDGDACTTSCAAAFCGDGFVQVGVEDCDDGNMDDTDACNNMCKAGSGCGNGIVEAGEECDDGNQSNADDCLTTCKKATCGDGYAEIGVEECDDGNMDDTDNCTNSCKLNQTGNFTCPGTVEVVDVLMDTLVQGDTGAAMNTYAGSCGGGAAPEIVYQVMPAMDGVLTITMDGVGMQDPVLYARKDDCAMGAEIGCADLGIGNAKETLVTPVIANTPIWVFADGYDGTSGIFQLTFHLDTSVAGDTCPGIPVALTPAMDIMLNGNTAAAKANYKGTGNCSMSNSTKEIVYAVTPSQDGMIFVSLDPTYDGELYARDGACTTGNQIACSEMAGVGGLEVISFAAIHGTKYSVFVDGKNGSAGMYNVSFHLQ